jgi:hypothetical protein
MRRFVVVVASVLVAIVAVGAGPALALTGKVRHWLETYVRHLIRQRVTGSTPAFAANLRGDIATAGNTLETCPANLSASRRRGARASEPCLNQNNNDLNMVYVNADPGNGRFNSSTATLTMPAGARVVKAYLYWSVSDRPAFTVWICHASVQRARPRFVRPRRLTMFQSRQSRSCS